jgi:hypothetical protein
MKTTRTIKTILVAAILLTSGAIAFAHGGYGRYCWQWAAGCKAVCL